MTVAFFSFTGNLRWYSSGLIAHSHLIFFPLLCGFISGHNSKPIAPLAVIALKLYPLANTVLSFGLSQWQPLLSSE